MKEIRRNCFKTTEAETDNATTLSMVEEAGNAASVGDNKTHPNGGSRKDECSNSTTIAENKVDTTQPICYRDRQRKELLHLWRIQAHGLSL